MAKITIEINCEEKTCGKCIFFSYKESRGVCKYFFNSSLERNVDWKYLRCPNCLAAEVRNATPYGKQEHRK